MKKSTKTVGTSVQQQSTTTNEEVALIQERERTFESLKHHLNGIKDSNKNIIIQAVLMYRLGYNKESLFERVKQEYKGSDNWTAIRVNATRNFTSAEGLLKIAKSNGVDISKWSDSNVVDNYMKEQGCTINGLYKAGQKSKDEGTDVPNGKEVGGAVITDLNRFEDMVLKAIEKYEKKVDLLQMADSLACMVEHLKKKAKHGKKAEKVA